MMSARSRLCRFSILLCISGLMGAGVLPALAEGDPVARFTASYLAGRAAVSSDQHRPALQYNNAALAIATPPELVSSATLSAIIVGEHSTAEALARQHLRLSPDKPPMLISMILGVAAFKAGNLDLAKAHFASPSGPIAQITSNLALAWINLASGDYDGAVIWATPANPPDWFKPYYQYHRALLADVAGRTSAATQAHAELNDKSPEIRFTFARLHSASASGNPALAANVLRSFLQAGKNTTLAGIIDVQRRLGNGETLPLLVAAPADGLAEVFYGIGEALTADGGYSMGTAYLQLAIQLSPGHEFALTTLAAAQGSKDLHAEAIATYERVPKASPLQPSIEIRKAQHLNSLDRVDEAKAALERLAQTAPTDIESLATLGQIMSGHKRFEEAIGYYSRVIALIGANPVPAHWDHFYGRAVSYDQAGRWSEAEADLRTALKLDPERWQAFNYLGYSMVDQNRNLKLARELIEQAVKLRPDDGYVLDSLGWAQFRQGDFKGALLTLSKAAELRPNDPSVNDHLGDALWRSGQPRQARFQWTIALSLDPSTKDATAIRRKLEVGLR